MEHALDLGLASDPLGERDTRFPMLFQAHRERAQAPLTEINVVRTRRLTELVGRAPEPRPGFLRAGDRTEHGVGVADDVFGGRLHRDVHAVRKRLEVQRRPPGVVGDDGDPAAARGFRNRRDVLHLESERAGRFEIDHPGFGPDERLDGAPHERIEKRRAHAKAFEKSVREVARRGVDSVAHEQVISGRQEGEQGPGAGGEPRRVDDRAVPSFQCGDRLLERFDRRRTEAPVVGARLFQNPVLAPAAELRNGFREDRRGVEHRRVHGAVMPLGVESGMDDGCLFAHGAPS